MKRDYRNNKRDCSFYFSFPQLLHQPIHHHCLIRVQNPRGGIS